jgi:peptidoglycan hydrolase CwlO-like protein
MNKKIIAAIIALVVIIIAGYSYFYLPYQDNILSENYDQGLQNASGIETKIIATTEQFNNQQSTDADVLMNTINNDIVPKYGEEIDILNKTLDNAKNNATKTKYIELQCKRLELESKNLNATVSILNAISQYVKQEKSPEDAQSSIDNANTELTNTKKELDDVYVDIRTLLTQNPDFNQTLQDLHLEKPFYGETRVEAQTQTIANATT